MQYIRKAAASSKRIFSQVKQIPVQKVFAKCPGNKSPPRKYQTMVEVEYPAPMVCPSQIQTAAMSKELMVNCKGDDFVKDSRIGFSKRRSWPFNLTFV